MSMKEKSILMGPFPTQRQAILLRRGCSESYTKVAKLPSKSDTPQCPSVVANKQMQVTYIRTLSINEAPHSPSLVSTEQGHTGFKHGKLKKTKGLVNNVILEYW